MNMYQHEDDPKEESNQEECCRNCRFFRRTANDWGKCYRFPPSYAERQGAYDQPGTRGEWWCGEWKSDE